MSKLKIIIGNSGQEKINYIYNYFKTNSRNSDGTIDFSKKFFLIVPEQDTASKQRKMLEAMNAYGAGILNIDVISFDRLCYMVFDECNIDIKNEKMVMDDAKTMLLRLALINIKKRKIKLPYFEKSIDKLGFAEKLMSCMSEFYTYGIDANKLETIENKIKNDTIREKVRELKIINDEFIKLIKEKNFYIKEDKLNLLRDNIENTKLLDGAIVAFDGFTGFTPIQNEIFSKIYDKAEKVFVTVTIRDVEYENMINKKNVGIFSISKTFIDGLVKVLEDKGEKKDDLFLKVGGIEVSPLQKCHPYAAYDIRFLERNLFLYNKEKYEKEVSNIEIYATENVNREIDFLIKKIFRLTKFENYTYNDIKIVVPSLDDYRDLLIRKFDENNIKLFVDDKNKIYTSPLIEYINSMFEIIGTDFSKDAVLRFINSGIFDKNYSNIYFLIDNFIRKYNINGYNQYKQNLIKYKTKIIKNLKTGGKYINEISMSIENITETLENILSPVFLVYEKYRDNKYKMTLLEFVDCIKDFLEDSKVLENFQNFLLELKTVNGENDKEYIVLKDNIEIINNIFDLINVIAKDDNEKITIDDFKKIFDLSVENINIKTIPYAMEQIVVGDVMRSRFDEVKVLFFLGMNDTKIPLNSKDNNIINDEMRNIFRDEAGVILSQTILETAINSKFYLYNILTSPSDKLILSYTKKNIDDEIDFRANVLDEIQNIFGSENLKEKYPNDEKDLYTINATKKYLADNFYDMYMTYKNNENHISSDDFEFYKKTYDYIKEIEDAKDFNKFNHMITNNFKMVSDENINKNIISALQKNFRGSATALETFAECPFKHFAKNIMSLRDVDRAEITNIDIGNISHYFMEWLFNLNREIEFSNGEKKIVKYTSIKEMKDTEIRELVEIGVDENITKIDKLMDETNKSKFMIDRIKDMIEKTVINMREHLKVSMEATEVFVEYGAMHYLLDKDANILKGNEQEPFLDIIGRIDKIELFKRDDKIYVKVIDYKSSIKELKNKNILEGIEIQLLVYLDYCLHYLKNISMEYSGFNEVIPLGAFYSPIMDKIDYISDFNSEVIMDDYNNLDYNKLSGIVNVCDGVDIIDSTFEVLDKDFKSNVINTKNKENFKNKEEIEELLLAVRKKIVDDLKNIQSGEIRVRPIKNEERDACKTCLYKNLCKYENAYVGDL